MIAIKRDGQEVNFDKSKITNAIVKAFEEVEKLNAVGDKDEVMVEKLEGDEGRDMNLAKATIVALQLLLDLLKKRHPAEEE